jgi:hypothetical protein
MEIPSTPEGPMIQCQLSFCKREGDFNTYVSKDCVSPLSESDVHIELEFEGGVILRGLLDRVLGPAIVEELKYKLPIEGRAVYLRGEMKITLDLAKGNLKPTREVKRGQIAYMPLGDTLCIYLQDMKTATQVNVLGRILSEDDSIDPLTDVRRGSIAKIRMVQ